MLVTLLVHVPLALAPLLQPPFPPECQLDVLTPMALEERSVAGFHANVDAYLALHRVIARALPPSEMFDDEDPFFADELRRALVAARPGARPGGFFTPSVAESFRRRIDLALAYSGGSAIPFRPDPFVYGATPTVNEPLLIVPDGIGWAPLLATLPPLPPQLAYVVTGPDLALVDDAANLVIDVLFDAVPSWPGSDVTYR
jgi:hypothetical protein